jgi:hypothetical protein
MSTRTADTSGMNDIRTYQSPAIPLEDEPALADQGLRAVAALYVDPRDPCTRAAFFDDGRYLFWDTATVIRGTYETTPGTVITGALAILQWDEDTGRLHNDLWSLTRLGEPLNDLARSAAGHTWLELEDALKMSAADIDAEVDAEVALAVIDRTGAVTCPAPLP